MDFLCWRLIPASFGFAHGGGAVFALEDDLALGDFLEPWLVDA
jgi:hypothetical protein